MPEQESAPKKQEAISPEENQEMSSLLLEKDSWLTLNKIFKALGREVGQQLLELEHPGKIAHYLTAEAKINTEQLSKLLKQLQNLSSNLEEHDQN